MSRRPREPGTRVPGRVPEDYVQDTRRITELYAALRRLAERDIWAHHRLAAFDAGEALTTEDARRIDVMEGETERVGGEARAEQLVVLEPPEERPRRVARGRIAVA